MILQLDDNYRIATDEYNFILQRKMDPEKNPRKGKRAKSAEKWKNIGCWKDLSQLLTSYSRQVLRTEIGDTNLEDLSRDLRTLTQAIERIGEQCVTLSARRAGCSATLISDL
jgi:hypothetical protein